MKRVIWLTMGMVLLFPFQNCSKLGHGTKDSALQQSGGGTGNGYDGKVYVLTAPQPCADKTFVQAAILVKSETDAQLFRENCANVEPRNLPANSFVVVAEELVFQGQTYKYHETPQVPVPERGIAPGPARIVTCSRFATAANGGFDGKVTIELHILSAVGGIAVVRQSARDGSWERSKSFEIYPGSGKLTDEQIYVNGIVDRGDFKFIYLGGQAMMSYFFETFTETGVSKRPPFEQWYDDSTFSCGI